MKPEKKAIEYENAPMTNPSTPASLQSQAKVGAASGTNTKAANKRKRMKKEKQDGPIKRGTFERQNSRCSNEEKKVVDGNREKSNQRNQSSGQNIGGMIFMCNAKTKPDCFHFSVMGVTANKQEVVMGIRPGLKLFLYDIDLKLMYGIYEASSAGGMKLEPKAFGGGFPAQVRFKVHKDCLPIPESVFKKAIKDNYNERTHRFETELTYEQVKRLTVLFHPAAWSNINHKPSVEGTVPAPIVQPSQLSTLVREEESHREQVHGMQHNSKLEKNSTPSDCYDPLATFAHAHSQRPFFLTEKEYRSHGLQSERPFLPATSSVGTSAGHLSESYRPYYEKDQVLSSSTAAGNVDLCQKESGHADRLYPSEREYRTYGLKGTPEPYSRIIPGSQNNHESFCNPYDDSTTSLVNRYLSLPSTLPIPSHSYHLHASHLPAEGPYPNDSGFIHQTRDRFRRATIDGGMMHSSHYSPGIFSDSQHYHHLGVEPKLTSTSVSSRYSFAGSSVLRR